jgi:NAD+ synthetase
VGNNLSAMVLGISGGIDSTVVAAICHEVSERTNIPLIGRSLPTTFNKENEISTADLVGKAFCDDYKVVSIQNWYTEISDELFYTEKTPRKIVCNGNIQARLRMIYLYDLAGNNGGLVMDTDNLTENNLGYFTIHGDVGDFNPIGGLWKTEVFKLAKYLIDFYRMTGQIDKGIAMFNSWSLKPTAGLGITNNDLEEIGAESYDQVDSILQETLRLKEKNVNINTILETLYNNSNINSGTINNVVNRHFRSEFKRKQLPIKITRDEILL